MQTPNGHMIGPKKTRGIPSEMNEGRTLQTSSNTMVTNAAPENVPMLSASDFKIRRVRFLLFSKTLEKQRPLNQRLHWKKFNVSAL
jgi:hypothetical protein